jgi:hypothetical protein
MKYQDGYVGEERIEQKHGALWIHRKSALE